MGRPHVESAGMIQVIDDDDAIQIHLHVSDVPFRPCPSICRYISSIRSSPRRKSCRSASISPSVRYGPAAASNSALTRCKYCHQSSLLWAGDESERSTTSTGPAGKLGGLSNSNLPSGVKVPRTTTCSVAMTVPFMLPTLNPLPFVDGVFHFCTFCTEPVKTGIRVLQG